MSDSIAVIVTTCESERFLDAQLKSLTTQDYEDISIHVLDDDSTDGTIRIIYDFMQRYPNVYFYKNIKRLGFLKNFENGIDTIKSDYIALCDHDDIWRRDKLSVQMRELKRLEKEHSSDVPLLVHSDLKMIHDDGSLFCESFFKFRGIRPGANKNLSLTLGHNGVMGNTILMNRALADAAIPFPEYLKDHDYWLALVAEVAGKRSVVHKPLVEYRIHDDNASNSRGNLTYQNDIRVFIEELFSGESPLPFMENNRLQVVDELLSRFNITDADRNTIALFKRYLEQDGDKFSLARAMIKHDFIKPSIGYRLHFLLNMLTTNRYRINL